jgi:hypothetical protein
MHSNCVVRIYIALQLYKFLWQSSAYPPCTASDYQGCFCNNLTSSKDKHGYSTVQDRHTASEYNCKVGGRYTGFHAAFTTYTTRFDTGFRASAPVFFLAFFTGSLTGTITHVEVNNLVIMWLQFVIAIIIWKFPH